MQKPEKIRPPSHSSYQDGDAQPQRQHQTSTPDLRREAEGDLPDLVRAGDPATRTTVDGAVSANVQAAAMEAVQAPPQQFWPSMPPGARFTPDEAVELRRTMNEPNRMGYPRQPTDAEKLLANYQKALADYRADYAGTRSERLREPFLLAKQALIDAGLMKGDV